MFFFCHSHIFGWKFPMFSLEMSPWENPGGDSRDMAGSSRIPRPAWPWRKRRWRKSVVPLKWMMKLGITGVIKITFFGGIRIKPCNHFQPHDLFDVYLSLENNSPWNAGGSNGFCFQKIPSLQWLFFWFPQWVGSVPYNPPIGRKKSLIYHLYIAYWW